MELNRIYISGAITNVPDFKERFAKAEMYLNAAYPNVEIINPAKVTLPDTCTHADYMKIDLALLDLADCIYLLSNWETSKGACMEYGYALAKGKTVIFEGEE